MVDRVGEAESGPDSPLEEQEVAVTNEEQPQEVDERPQWLPEKFDSAEDLARGYKQLERKFSSRQDSEQGLLTAKDFSQYQKEFDDNGELGDKAYATLAKKGLSKEIVDSYIQGQMHLQEQETKELYNIAGGVENYERMSSWAAENVDQDELDAFNEALASGETATAKMAIRGMYAQYGASDSKGEPQEISPNLIHGEGSPTAVGYGSAFEMKQDMSNPLYKEGDKKFHAMVERRLMATSSDVI